MEQITNSQGVQSVTMKNYFELLYKMCAPKWPSEGRSSLQNYFWNFQSTDKWHITAHGRYMMTRKQNQLC